MSSIAFDQEGGQKRDHQFVVSCDCIAAAA
jgi:hypothetical protein